MEGGMDRDGKVVRGGMEAVGVIVIDMSDDDGGSAEGLKGNADGLRAGTPWVWR